MMGSSPHFDWRFATLLGFVLVASASEGWGNQSALDPASDTAEKIFDLTIVMTVGAAAIQVLVAGLVIAGIYGHWRWRHRIASVRFVFTMGVIFPAVILTALLLYGLLLMREGPTAPLPGDAAAPMATT
jgi:cytochrome c oxidase subunit 2